MLFFKLKLFMVYLYIFWFKFFYVTIGIGIFGNPPKNRAVQKSVRGGLDMSIAI